MTRRVIAVIFLGAILFYSHAVAGQQKEQTGVPTGITNAVTEQKIEQETYIYNAGDRRDPFLSIIMAEKAAKEDMQRLKNVPPLEAYDLSQFKLIAILWEKNRYAVVGLPNGKFYNIKEGMTVGVNEGRVLKITPKTVAVRERIRDYRGKITSSDTILTLRKEEEEE